ncbi:MAG: ComEC/Rec2 family competence protein, partial [Muribaculaceae bacterium]|nr:ComEC/Rec2 family competence protein [Muribaculaceae bacterium]
SYAEGDQFFIDIESLIGSSGKRIETIRLKFRLVTDGLSASEGDILLFPVHLKKIEDNPNYRSNGFKERMRKKGVYYTSEASCSKISIVRTSNSIHSFFSNVRNNLIIKIEKSKLSKSCKGFLIALLLGDKTSLNVEEKENFSNAGVAHVLALSGMHVAIIVGALLTIFLPLNFFANRNIRLWVVLGLLWCYVLLTGCSLSTVRAALMMSFVVLTLTYQRKGNSFNSLLGATFIILLFYPSAVFDVGLQLSFLSVGSIVFFSEHFNPVERKNRFRHYIMSAVLTTMIATFTTWIVVDYYFNTVPLLFLPANLLVLPLLPVFMTISLVWLLLNLLGFDSSVLTWVVENLYWLISSVVDFISSISQSEIDFKVSLPIVITWLGGIVTLGIFIADKKKRWALAISLNLFLFSVVFAPLIPAEKDNFIIIQNHRHAISLAVYN